MALIRTIPLVFYILVILSGCNTLTSSDLANKDDYESSRKKFAAKRIGEALEEFPTKEPGGFVTSLERGWLQMLTGNFEVEELREVADDLEARQTLHYGTEVKTFFYKETEDRYLPAEHEAILLHIVTGLSLAAEGDRTAARVEAARASRYLEKRFASDRPFDDPVLRLWLSSLWLYCGEWNFARVGFRVAAGQHPRLKWLAKIADQPRPPKYMALAFGGDGPEVRPTHDRLGVRFVDPKPQAYKILNRSNKKFRGSGPLYTKRWFKRHQERNQAIKDVVDKSRQMIGLVSGGTVATTVVAAGALTGVAVAAGGIAGGLVLAKVVGGELGFELFLASSLMGIGGGVYIYNAADEKADEILNLEANPARYYRFVRFMPSTLQFALSQAGAPRVLRKGRQIKPFLKLRSPRGETQIQFFHQP